MTRAGCRGTFLVRGDAGIGKTTLWLAGGEAAAARGYRVLASRPSEAGAGLSFVGLADLIGTVANFVLPALPPIQRRALEAALLLGDVGDGFNARAVAAGLLSAVRLLATDGRICVAIDDLQWLDPASCQGGWFRVSFE